MKKGVFLIFKFKSLFSCILVFALTVSSAFLLSAGFNKVQSKQEPVNVNAEIVSDNDALPLIIVDPGHGGEDGGTASSKGVLEKDINLSISHKVNDLLTFMGYETIMTRTEDNLIYSGTPSTMREKKVSDIQNRMKIISENPNSIFLSIHQNYFTQSKYSGAQVFYSGGNSESKAIAETLQKSIVSAIQNDNIRKVKQSGNEIYLLYHATTPAVMVECGFMSNPGEALLLCDEEYQKKMAFAIVSGITDYLKIKGEI